MSDGTIRQFPRAVGRQLPSDKASRKVFVVYKRPLFHEVIANLLKTAPEVEIVGSCDCFQAAAQLIVESEAETVIVEGDSRNSRDLSVLNYLMVSSAEADWLDLVMLSMQDNEVTWLYRGNISQLNADQLLSLFLMR